MRLVILERLLLAFVPASRLPAVGRPFRVDLSLPNKENLTHAVRSSLNFYIRLMFFRMLLRCVPAGIHNRHRV